MVATSAISFRRPPAEFPRKKIIEQPITHVYSAPIGPVKSRLTIIGIPVKSHETVPAGKRGKGTSKGGPLTTSDVAAKAPNMLVNASFLVSSFFNYVSLFKKKRVYVKSYFMVYANFY